MRPFTIQTSKEAPLTLIICLWCLYVYVMMQGVNTHAQEIPYGALSDYEIFSGKYWGLISKAFVHVELMHLLFNLSWLWNLGWVLERSFGTFKFGVFILLTAFVSSGMELLLGHSGIGLSGIVYAMIGFGWMGRKDVLLLARMMTKQTMQIALGWGVLCVVLTQLGIWHIANMAHAGGLAMGAVIGTIYYEEEWRIAGIAGAIALIGLAVMSIVWNPQSTEWYSAKAYSSYKQGKYVQAEFFVKKAIGKGANQEWAKPLLLLIYRAEGKTSEATALEFELIQQEVQTEKSGSGLQNR